jgi:hypothetical protein
VQHAWQLNIVDVIAAAPDEAGILLAQHPAVPAGLLVVVGGIFWAQFDGGHALASTSALLAAHWMDRTIVV